MKGEHVRKEGPDVRSKSAFFQSIRLIVLLLCDSYCNLDKIGARTMDI